MRCEASHSTAEYRHRFRPFPFFTTIMSGSSGNSSQQVRTRSQRVASVVMIQGRLAKAFSVLKNDLRFYLIALMLLMNLAVCFTIEAWKPPFPHRLHDVPRSPIVCSTPFRLENPDATETAIQTAVLSTPHIYQLDSAPFVRERDALINAVLGILQTANFEEVDPALWRDFIPPTTPENQVDPNAEGRKLFESLKSAFPDENGSTRFRKAIEKTFRAAEQKGFTFGPLDRLQQEGTERILVMTPDGKETSVYNSEVILGNGSRVRDGLNESFSDPRIVDSLFHWIFPKMRAIGSTLRLDVAKTQEAMEKAQNAVETQYTEYTPGRVLVPSGTEITPPVLKLLRDEYSEYVKHLSVREKTARFFGVYALFALAHCLGWIFMYRRERRKPKTFLSSCIVLFFLLVTVMAGKFLISFSFGPGHLELIPLLIFAQSLAITFSWEMAMVLSLCVAFNLVVADGTRFDTMLILMGTTIAVIEQLGRLHTRSKLITVGLVAGGLSFVITFTAGILDGRPVAQPLFGEAILNALWTLAAGFAMTGLLPFIEKPFGILTDMSLMELGDVSHPLLQEMIRRAPATYNHSFQVGSIAESAAEAIGARGLMTRVGAYFHDIGKILKPQYFTENQTGENIHDSLEPRMSALVIVAHVKDGADLARQHRLPRPLIDLIEQHHGTSLVSYFYGMASRQNKDNPYGQGVEESSFRYPGPRPRSKEAGILMLADAAESAVRSMGDSATPGRIENMVRQITDAKMKDGQFDECGLTLHELRVVEKSIINSLIAIRHIRIKYPGQDKSLASTAARPEDSPSVVTMKTDSTVVADSSKIVKKEV